MNVQEIRDNCKFKYQQGDVILRKMEGVEFDKKTELTHRILVPSTNPHKASAGTLYSTPEGMVLDAPSGATITHKEHKAIKLPAGTYHVEPIVEVDFLSDMVRPVVD